MGSGRTQISWNQPSADLKCWRSAVEKTRPSSNKDARAALHRKTSNTCENHSRPLTSAACGRVPEVGRPEEVQLRLQLLQADAVTRGGVRPDDVQHLNQEPGHSLAKTLT